VALWQTVNVTPNVDYSLSAWMTSLCGGSSSPSSCPPGAYMAKMAALEPSGGQNPAASTLRWVEDRRPHTEALDVLIVYLPDGMIRHESHQAEVVQWPINPSIGCIASFPKPRA
jgi:hypothetical protein